MRFLVNNCRDIRHKKNYETTLTGKLFTLNEWRKCPLWLVRMLESFLGQNVIDASSCSELFQAIFLWNLQSDDIFLKLAAIVKHETAHSSASSELKMIGVYECITFLAIDTSQFILVVLCAYTDQRVRNSACSALHWLWKRIWAMEKTAQSCRSPTQSLPPIQAADKSIKSPEKNVRSPGGSLPRTLQSENPMLEAMSSRKRAEADLRTLENRWEESHILQ